MALNFSHFCSPPCHSCSTPVRVPTPSLPQKTQGAAKRRSAEAVLQFFIRSFFFAVFLGNQSCRERKREERIGAGPFLETILQHTVNAQEIPQTVLQNGRFPKLFRISSVFFSAFLLFRFLSSFNWLLFGPFLPGSF